MKSESGKHIKQQHASRALKDGGRVKGQQLSGSQVMQLTDVS